MILHRIGAKSFINLPPTRQELIGTAKKEKTATAVFSKNHCISSRTKQAIEMTAPAIRR